MKIPNTTWQTIAEENKREGGLIFGYEAPANVALLRQLQKYGVLVEVVGKTSDSRLIRPDNPDAQVFTPDQKFRIMEENQTFGRFEKALSTMHGKILPEERFDEFVKWVDPKAYKKTNRGYRLPLDHLSYDKRRELEENLKGLATGIKDNTILISGSKNVENLEYSWKEYANQKKREMSLTGLRQGINR